MKVLIIGLERAGNLFFVERLFRKKLDEAELHDVEITTTNVAELGSPDGRRIEAAMKELLLKGADFIIVMEKWQKDLLTRFIEYRAWDKIHLFADRGHKQGAVYPPCGGDFEYHNGLEMLHSECRYLVEHLKSFMMGKSEETSMVFG